MKTFRDYNTTHIKMTVIFAFLYAILVLVPCILISPNAYDKYLSLLICGFGSVLGWVFGFFISPDNPEEEKNFSKISRNLSAFITGYVLSKIDKPITAYIEKATKLIESNQQLVISDLTSVRIIGFLVSLLFTIISTFIFRVYSKRGLGDD